MSANLATISWPEVAKRANVFTRIFKACRGGIARHLGRRTAIATLHKLDDRVLRDIGLARSEIEAAVDGLINLRD
jgi:uncharacterized protein YjiS (DUF1127 family)